MKSKCGLIAIWLMISFDSFIETGESRLWSCRWWNYQIQKEREKTFTFCWNANWYGRLVSEPQSKIYFYMLMMIWFNYLLHHKSIELNSFPREVELDDDSFDLFFFRVYSFFKFLLATLTASPTISFRHVISC